MKYNTVLGIAAISTWAMSNRLHPNIKRACQLRQYTPANPNTQVLSSWSWGLIWTQKSLGSHTGVKPNRKECDLKTNERLKHFSEKVAWLLRRFPPRFVRACAAQKGWWLSCPGTALTPLRCFDILSEFKRTGPLLACQLGSSLHADSTSSTSSCLPQPTLTFCLLLGMEWVRVHRLPVLPTRELICCAASFHPPLSSDNTTCETCTKSGVEPQESLRGITGRPERQRWSHSQDHHSLSVQWIAELKDTEQSHLQQFPSETTKPIWCH